MYIRLGAPPLDNPAIKETSTVSPALACFSLMSLFADVWSRATEESLGRAKQLKVTTEAELEYTRLTWKEK